MFQSDGPSIADITQHIINEGFAKAAMMELRAELEEAKSDYDTYFSESETLEYAKFVLNDGCATESTWNDYNDFQKEMITNTNYLSRAKSIFQGEWMTTDFNRFEDLCNILKGYCVMASIRLFALLSYEGESRNQMICDPPNAQHYIQTIHRAIKQQQNLIEDVTDLLRIISDGNKMGAGPANP